MAQTPVDETAFLPASATSAKSRKAGKRTSTKGKPTSTFLSTQPSAAHDVEMDDMDFERLPLDDRSPAAKKAASANLKRGVVDAAQAQAAMDEDGDGDDDDGDDSVMIDPQSLSHPSPVTRIPISSLPGADALSFPAVSHTTTSGLTQRRKVAIPPHRMTPLKRDWIKIYSPLVEECGLQVRMNVKRRWVEMKVRSGFIGACAGGPEAHLLLSYRRPSTLRHRAVLPGLPTSSARTLSASPPKTQSHFSVSRSSTSCVSPSRPFFFLPIGSNL